MTRVKATQRGYLGSLREQGDEFDLPPNHKLGSWMEVISVQAELPLPAAPVSEASPPDEEPSIA